MTGDIALLAVAVVAPAGLLLAILAGVAILVAGLAAGPELEARSR
jgi:hypothetical protein